MVAEAAPLEFSVLFLYLGGLLALLGFGTFLVVRQVLVKRELENAAKELQDRVRSGEATSEEYFELGAIMLRKKFFAVANKYLELAIAKWEGDEQELAQVYNALGFSYFSEEKMKEAVKAYEKAVSLQPAYVTAWNNLGDALERQKEWARALKAYDTALVILSHSCYGIRQGTIMADPPSSSEGDTVVTVEDASLRSTAAPPPDAAASPDAEFPAMAESPQAAHNESRPRCGCTPPCGSADCDRVLCLPGDPKQQHRWRWALAGILLLFVVGVATLVTLLFTLKPSSSSPSPSSTSTSGAASELNASAIPKDPIISLNQSAAPPDNSSSPAPAAPPPPADDPIPMPDLSTLTRPSQARFEGREGEWSQFNWTELYVQKQTDRYHTCDNEDMALHGETWKVINMSSNKLPCILSNPHSHLLHPPRPSLFTPPHPPIQTPPSLSPAPSPSRARRWADQAGELSEWCMGRLVELVFHADRGLGLSMARYAIPGGFNAMFSPGIARTKHPLHGFKDGPLAPYNWSADAGQRRVMLAAKQLGVQHFEAIAYSPPWWMTISGDTAGNEDGKPNMRPEQRGAFVQYVVDVMQQYRTNPAWNITFEHINPFNEALEGWWRAGRLREGCSVSVNDVDVVVALLADALQASGLPTRISVADSWVAYTLRSIKSETEALRPETWEKVDHICVHGYQSKHFPESWQIGVQYKDMRDSAARIGKEVWQSEWGPIDIYGTDLQLAMYMARTATEHINIMGVAAWYYWMAVEPNTHGWGLIRFLGDCGENVESMKLTFSKQYYVMKHFTRAVPVGARIVVMEQKCEHGVVVAYSPQHRRLAILVTNQSFKDFLLTLRLLDFLPADPSVPVLMHVHRTSVKEDYEMVDQMNVKVPGNATALSTDITINAVPISLTSITLYEVLATRSTMSAICSPCHGASSPRPPTLAAATFSAAPHCALPVGRPSLPRSLFLHPRLSAPRQPCLRPSRPIRAPPPAAALGGLGAVYGLGAVDGQLADALLHGVPLGMDVTIASVHHEVAQLAASAGIPLDDPVALREWIASVALLLAYASAPPSGPMGLLDFLVAPLHTVTFRRFSPSEVKVGRQLGHGNFGVVYEATVTGPRGQAQRVVVKRKAAGAGADEMQDVELFMNHRLQRTVPGVAAKFLGTMEVQPGNKLQEGVWLVWQHQGDSTLDRHLKDRQYPAPLAAMLLGVQGDAGGWSEEQRMWAEWQVAQTVMRQILSNLQALHHAGVVHRDVKPANLVVDEAERHLCLIDLGACVDLRSGRNYVPSETVMDPKYAAPERFVMPPATTPHLPPDPLASLLSPFLWVANSPDRFDVFSAGVVLMQLSLKSLRHEANLEGFNNELKRCDYDLSRWRKKFRPSNADMALLDAHGGAAFDLAKQLLQKRPNHDHAVGEDARGRHKDVGRKKGLGAVEVAGGGAKAGERSDGVRGRGEAGRARGDVRGGKEAAAQGGGAKEGSEVGKGLLVHALKAVVPPPIALHPQPPLHAPTGGGAKARRAAPGDKAGQVAGRGDAEGAEGESSRGRVAGVRARGERGRAGSRPVDVAGAVKRGHVATAYVLGSLVAGLARSLDDDKSRGGGEGDAGVRHGVAGSEAEVDEGKEATGGGGKEERDGGKGEVEGRKDGMEREAGRVVRGGAESGGRWRGRGVCGGVGSGGSRGAYEAAGGAAGDSRGAADVSGRAGGAAGVAGGVAAGGLARGGRAAAPAHPGQCCESHTCQAQKVVTNLSGMLYNLWLITASLALFVFSPFDLSSADGKASCDSINP
ncbi:unnamed protein product [Closterium sp. Yama58-4]|nr:unnamed protein product [Closterium sp. Yama58-4]